MVRRLRLEARVHLLRVMQVGCRVCSQGVCSWCAGKAQWLNGPRARRALELPSVVAVLFVRFFCKVRCQTLPL